MLDYRKKKFQLKLLPNHDAIKMSLTKKREIKMLVTALFLIGKKKDGKSINSH